MSFTACEVQWDGLVGPTHNYAGLSPGNVASEKNEGSVSNPRAAVLEGLAKMRFVMGLGVPQAVLPPHARPSLPYLRAIGFSGSDEQILLAAARADGGHPLRVAMSASSMWTANAATVAPSQDTEDGRLHLTPANLVSMAHRAIEASQTTRVLRAIFADERHFSVHDPLFATAHYGDEGAANHTRLATTHGVVHLFAWGRSGFGLADERLPTRYPARQTREASEAVVRHHALTRARVVYAKQHPDGIDRGAFHTDVLAVGNERALLFHSLAFEQKAALLDTLRRELGEELWTLEGSDDELPAEDAVASYPFNSQLLTLPSGAMTIVAPEDAKENPRARAFLERALSAGGPIGSVHYLDVRQSMRNGGGPACLRLRMLMTSAERKAVSGRVFCDDALLHDLSRWATRHYRDRLAPTDLADPSLWRETMGALDALTQLLQLPSLYDFQRA